MGEYYGIRMKDDPDGEYLQHWGLPKGFMREGHKYLARLVTPSGYRYIYNQAELAAAKAGRAIKGAANAVGNAIGINQRNRAQGATARARRISEGNNGREQSVQGIKRARMANATAKRAQNAYDKTLLGRAEKMFNGARKSVNDAVDAAGKQANKLYKQAGRQAKGLRRNIERTAQNVGKAVGDATGYNQRNRAQASANRAQRIAGGNNGREQSVQAIKRGRMAKKTAQRAQNAYERTPLGRAENAVNTARRNAAGAANDALNTVSKTARRVDNALGITGKGRRNKRAAAYKREMLNRRNTSPKRKTTADDLARRHGVDSALDLMRTGQGLDPYNITKRGAAYRRKKRR